MKWIWGLSGQYPNQKRNPHSWYLLGSLSRGWELNGGKKTGFPSPPLEVVHQVRTKEHCSVREGKFFLPLPVPCSVVKQRTISRAVKPGSFTHTNIPCKRKHATRSWKTWLYLDLFLFSCSFRVFIPRLFMGKSLACPTFCRHVAFLFVNYQDPMAPGVILYVT